MCEPCYSFRVKVSERQGTFLKKLGGNPALKMVSYVVEDVSGKLWRTGLKSSPFIVCQPTAILKVCLEIIKSTKHRLLKINMSFYCYLSRS